jgi:7-cyano-7-deazaguanine synthase in queuosine biosynthesis
MERADKILLFSGGVDSVVAYFYLNKPKCLHVDMFTIYSRMEDESIEKFEENTNCFCYNFSLDLSYFEQPDANIPARNVLLLTMGAYYADNIYLVAQRGEDLGADRCGSFFKRMSQTLTDCHQRKIVCDPVFPGKTKQDMVKFYKEQKLPIQYLLDAYSCYSGQERACSTCPACFRKFIALEYNRIDTSSIIDRGKLLNSSTTINYLKNMKDIHTKYDRKRVKQTLETLKQFGVK